jgi:acetone carboxylase beta subunit
LAGKPPLPTYLATEVAVVAQVATLKPQIVKYDLEAKRPAKKALKAVRPVFQNGRWQDARIYEMEELRPGNQLSGLAVVEAPNTTLFIPPDWQLKIDAYNVYWLTQGAKKR